MNIKDLVEAAKERISKMTDDEIRAKFIEAGYVPSEEDQITVDKKKEDNG